MNIVYFIDTNYVFNNTTLDKNIDPETINKSILMAQRIDIQQILGANLYNKLVTDIFNTDTTTGYYLTLLTDYVNPCLALYTYYRAMSELNYQSTNKGIQEKSSDYSKPIDLETLKYKESKMLFDCQFLSTRITEYLKFNRVNFPELNTVVNPFDLKPINENYFGGMYIPGNDYNGSSLYWGNCN